MKGKTAFDKWPALLQHDAGSAASAAEVGLALAHALPGLSSYPKAEPVSRRTPCRRRVGDPELDLSCCTD